MEHYAICPCVVRFGRSFLNIGRGPNNNQVGQFITLGLCDGTVAEDDLVRKALWVYATYRAVMETAHEEMGVTHDFQELLKQFAREGVQGHGRSTFILDSSFARIAPQGDGALEDAFQDWQEDL